MANTYTFPTPPNPQVYRLAAERLARGDTTFSCFAIFDAARRLRFSRLESDLHVAQYVAVFGPNHGVAPFAQVYNGTCCGCGNHQALFRVQSRHPFWNKSRTPRRQEMRILALLLMADICENPT